MRTPADDSVDQVAQRDHVVDVYVTEFAFAPGYMTEMLCSFVRTNTGRWRAEVAPVGGFVKQYQVDLDPRHHADPAKARVRYLA